MSEVFNDLHTPVVTTIWSWANGSDLLNYIQGELKAGKAVTVATTSRHIPVSSPAVPRFLKRFEEVYGNLGKTETILATAAAVGIRPTPSRVRGTAKFPPRPWPPW